MIDYCLNQDPHFGHTFVREELRGDALARVEVECPGIGTQHCSRVDGHEEHLFEEDGSRYLCEGTEVEPSPAPEYEERYCRIPGGCTPHLYVLNGEEVWCPGGNTTAEESERRAVAETPKKAKA